MGFGSILKKIGAVAGVAAAPFTGGASLALTLGSIGADIAGSVIEGKAINKAAGQQNDAIERARLEVTQGRNAALDLGDQTIGAIRENLNPYQDVGEDALLSLSEAEADPAFQFDQSKVEMDPGFQFRMSEAMKALSRSAAGRMRLKSGDTLKQLERYGQDLASDEYGRAYSRAYTGQKDAYDTMVSNQRRRRDELMGLTQIGRGATSEENQALGDRARIGADIYNRSSQNLSDLAIDSGNVNAAATVGGARNTTNTIDRIVGGVGDLLSLRGGSSYEQPDDIWGPLNV